MKIEERERFVNRNESSKPKFSVDLSQFFFSSLALLPSSDVKHRRMNTFSAIIEKSKQKPHNGCRKMNRATNKQRNATKKYTHTQIEKKTGSNNSNLLKLFRKKNCIVRYLTNATNMFLILSMFIVHTTKKTHTIQNAYQSLGPNTKQCNSSYLKQVTSGLWLDK